MANNQLTRQFISEVGFGNGLWASTWQEGEQIAVCISNYPRSQGPDPAKFEAWFPGPPDTLLRELAAITQHALRHHQELREPTPRSLPGEQVPAYEGREGVDWFHEGDVRADNPAVQLEEE